MEATIQHWISQYGYIGIFSLLMLGIVGVPIPDEALLAFSGYLAFKGELSVIPAITSAFLGSICGISISYWIGRRGGPLLIHRYGYRFHLTEERMERIRQWLDHAGRWGLIIGYFIPGVRHLTALVAGASQLRYPVFAAFAYAGGLLWSATFVTAGFFLEREWLGTTAAIHRWMLIALAAITAMLLGYYLVRRRPSKKA